VLDRPGSGMRAESVHGLPVAAGRGAFSVGVGVGVGVGEKQAAASAAHVNDGGMQASASGQTGFWEG